MNVNLRPASKRLQELSTSGIAATANSFILKKSQKEPWEKVAVRSWGRVMQRKNSSVNKSHDSKCMRTFCNKPYNDEQILFTYNRNEGLH